MKKKLIIGLVLALVMVIVPSSVAFAYSPWDVEDPCVADNEDFWWGKGWDDGALEAHGGGTNSQARGVNLYQDDATDTGNLDKVELLSFTVGELDLPIIFQIPGTGIGVAGDSSPDTWYWAKEPRGYNFPPVAENPYVNPYAGNEGVFTVEVFGYSTHDTFLWEGGWQDRSKVLREDVYVEGTKNGVSITIEIPTGTEVTNPYNPYIRVTFLGVKLNGHLVFTPKNVDFSQPCTLTVVTDGVAEVITFTEIRDGLPVPVSD